MTTTTPTTAHTAKWIAFCETKAAELEAQAVRTPRHAAQFRRTAAEFRQSAKDAERRNLG